MGTVLSFKGIVTPLPRRDPRSAMSTGEVVIFPGVRIEHHASEPTRPLAGDNGDDGYDGVGGKRRPRKSS
jgi:hypothetical protein